MADDCPKYDACRFVDGSYWFIQPSHVSSPPGFMINAIAPASCSFLLWQLEALEEIRAGVLPEVPESLSTDAQDFIRKCLCVDPKDRPSAAKLLGHPFVRKPPTSGFFAPPR